MAQVLLDRRHCEIGIVQDNLGLSDIVGLVGK